MYGEESGKYTMERKRKSIQRISNMNIEGKVSYKDTTTYRGTNITSVRVTKYKRNKLNALIQLGKADNIDTLINILLDEYIETSLVKDEKKTFNFVLDIIQKRDC